MATRMRLLFLTMLLLQLGYSDGMAAELLEPAMSSKVDERLKAPLGKKEKFSVDTKTLFATVKLLGAEEDTLVNARFYQEGETQKLLAEDEVVTTGSRYISFALNAPEGGWPTGTYLAQFLLNGELAQELRFTIGDGGEETGDTSAADPDLPYEEFVEPQLGIAFDLPTGWLYTELTEDRDFQFYYPGETEMAELTIMLQAIDTRIAEVPTLDVQMIELENQFSRVEGFTILQRNQLLIGGRRSLNFLASYLASNKSGSTVEFRQVQYGVENGPFLLFVSYAGPSEVYEAQYEVFQHLLDTVRFLQPAP